MKAESTDEVPQPLLAGNLSASPARAYAGLIVLNDVRGEVEAYIEEVFYWELNSSESCSISRTARSWTRRP